MKKGRLRERLRYRYENFMSKGGGALFWSLLILFVIAFVISILFRKIFLWIDPNGEVFANFWEHIWLTFLQIIDPGAIAEDTGSNLLLKISAIISTLILGWNERTLDIIRIDAGERLVVLSEDET